MKWTGLVEAVGIAYNLQRKEAISDAKASPS